MADQRRQFVSVQSFRNLRSEFDALKAEFAAMLRANGQNGRGGFGVQRIKNKKVIPCKQCQEFEVAKLDQDIGPATIDADGMCYSAGQAIALEHDGSCYKDTLPADGNCRRINVASQFRCGTYYAGEVVTVMRRKPCEPWLIQSRPCTTYRAKLTEKPGEWEFQTADGPRTVVIPSTPDDVELNEVRTITQSCNGCEWSVACCGEEPIVCQCWPGGCVPSNPHDILAEVDVTIPSNGPLHPLYGNCGPAVCSAFSTFSAAVTLPNQFCGIAAGFAQDVSPWVLVCDTNRRWFVRTTISILNQVGCRYEVRVKREVALALFPDLVPPPGAAPWEAFELLFIVNIGGACPYVETVNGLTPDDPVTTCDFDFAAATADVTLTPV